MALTFVDSTKIILEAWGKFKVTLLEAVEVGDLLSWYNQDNDYTVQLADESDSQHADCVALEKGAAGATITAALKAVLGTLTIQSGDCGRGIPGLVYFADAEAFFGAKLFLGEDGEMDDTAGTTLNQPVGILLARDRILIDLVPKALGATVIGEGATLTEVTNEGLKVDFALALATSGGFYAIEANIDYEPDGDSGYASPTAIVGRVTLKAGMTFTGGQAGMEGVRGHLEFGDAAVVNQASSVFAALRGVITKTSGTPIFTDAEGICCLYLDNLANVDFTGLTGGYNTSMIFIANGGAIMDSAIRINGPKLRNLFFLERCLVEGMVSTGFALGGQTALVRCLIEVAGEIRTMYLTLEEAA